MQMMHDFEVTCQDAETGDEYEIVIQAESARAAVDQAQRAGHRATDAMPARPPRRPRPAGTSRRDIPPMREVDPRDVEIAQMSRSLHKMEKRQRFSIVRVIALLIVVTIILLFLF